MHAQGNCQIVHILQIVTSCTLDMLHAAPLDRLLAAKHYTKDTFPCCTAIYTTHSFMLHIIPQPTVFHATLHNIAPISASHVCTNDNLLCLQVLKLPLRSSACWMALATPAPPCRPPRSWCPISWQPWMGASPWPGQERGPLMGSWALPSKLPSWRHCPR